MRIPTGAKITVDRRNMPKATAIIKKPISAVSSAGPPGLVNSDRGATVNVPQMTAKNINIG